MNRRSYIDWLRGVAVVIMIEAHTIDAWTVTDPAVRETDRYNYLQFIAGWAAPLFLALAGVSVALAASSHLRKGKSIAEASWLVQKRGWEVFALSLIFRLQSFMLSPVSHWETMLKVDILNIMGLSMVFAAWCWGRGATTKQRTQWLLGAAALCVLIAQYSPGWEWPARAGELIEGYVRSVPGTTNFMLFPWTGFVLIGAWLGDMLCVNRDVAADRIFHTRLAVAGAALLVGGIAGRYLPTFTPHSIFWLTSTSWFVIRLGVMTLLLAMAWLWMQRARANSWSPLVLFGKTSLFVYWVHVEIVYGFPTYPMRHKLSMGEAIAAYAAFTGVMLWLAVKWNQRTQGPLIPNDLRMPSDA